MLQKTPRLVNLHNLILDPGFRMDEMRSKFREVACDLHRMGLLTRCQEGEVPAWPGCHHGPAMSAKMASLLLTGSSKSAPAASSVQLSLVVRLPALSSVRQATLTLRLWSAHDPTFASACELAEGAPVGSPDSPVRSGLQFLHRNKGTWRGWARVPEPHLGTRVIT